MHHWEYAVLVSAIICWLPQSESPPYGTSNQQTVTSLQPISRPATEKELEQWWQLLADPDGQKAYEGVFLFFLRPKQSVPFLEKKVLYVPKVSPDAIQREIAKLDSKRYRIRVGASRQLLTWGELAEPILRKKLGEKLPLEQLLRMQRLVRQIQQIRNSPRLLRALRILELINNDAASRSLQRIGDEHVSKRMRLEAQRTLTRLRKTSQW